LTARAISTQVGSQGLADIQRHRHPIVKQPLASNEDFAGSPVNVLELESNYFSGAKTKTGKQKKDGIVAAARHRATVAGLEHTFNFPGSQVLGHG